MALPKGECRAGASGSPYARATGAKGESTLDISALPGLIGEFMTFVPNANRGVGDATPIKKAPIDAIKVVLKAFMASSSRGQLFRNQKSRSGRILPSTSESASHPHRTGL